MLDAPHRPPRQAAGAAGNRLTPTDRPGVAGRSLRRTATAAAGSPSRPRPHAWRELTLLTAVYLLYTLTRLLASGSHDHAVSNAHALLGAERLLGLAPERWLNHVVSARQLLAVPADYAYATWHYTVTLAVVVWLWRAHPAVYLFARRTLIAATLIALLSYWLVPMAPPRMLPGFVDTMGQYGSYGWWGDSASAPKGLGSLTNQFAAMPSLHVGWAIWCGWQLGQHARRRWVRGIGAAYPALTVLVVIGTGNHYLADTAAGLLVLVLGYTAARVVASVARRVWPTTVAVLFAGFPAGRPATVPHDARPPCPSGVQMPNVASGR